MKKSTTYAKFKFHNKIFYDFFCECLGYSLHYLYKFYSDFQPSEALENWQICNHSISENIENHVDLCVLSSGKTVLARDIANSFEQETASDKIPADCLAIYNLKNFRGGVTPLFACQRQNSKTIKIFDSTQTTLLPNIGLCDFEHPDTTLQVNIYDGGSSYQRPLSLADIEPLRAAQLIGINVPLILVQDLLKRDIKTKTMVDNDNIDFASRAILLPSRKIVFDLDETIIWNGRLVRDTMTFLQKAKKKGVNVMLLTRHKGDVRKALETVGLKYQDFDEVIQVRDEEKKSQFIKAPVVFVDNEFPERFDVRVNTGSLVLNLDTLKYCRFDND